MTPNAWQVMLADELARARELGRPAAVAGDVAFEACVALWHQQHGARPRQGRCAGCDLQLGPARFVASPGVEVCPGGATLTCLATYGRRWRGEAVAGLRAVGVTRPAPPPKRRAPAPKPPRPAREAVQLGLQLAPDDKAA